MFSLLRGWAYSCDWRFCLLCGIRELMQKKKKTPLESFLNYWDSNPLTTVSETWNFKNFEKTLMLIETDEKLNNEFIEIFSRFTSCLIYIRKH